LSDNGTIKVVPDTRHVPRYKHTGRVEISSITDNLAFCWVPG